MYIETLRSISGICLVIIVADVLCLAEQIFPAIETWFYSYVGDYEYALIDLAWLGFMLIGILRRSIF